MAVSCYDNAPMESFYSTLKTEYVSQHHFKDDECLNQGIYGEIYCWYNHVRPHSFNGGKAPATKRTSYS
ncbi:integrase core domain-containing protein [Cellulosilyticum sp. WCF-2]|uniref:integrase core domain-containing protein n=1 Tax=Cellulosilyticum sp. WCF-2 TaxID=2497860 RepID=UPI003FA4BF88